MCTTTLPISFDRTLIVTGASRFGAAYMPLYNRGLTKCTEQGTHLRRAGSKRRKNGTIGTLLA